MKTLCSDNSFKGMVFNIQKYSVHDGAGIRTIVFLKGCPLQCKWCSNPESQQTHPELARNEGRCIGREKCGFCDNVCPTGAMTWQDVGTPLINRARCNACLLCANACPTKSLTPYGSVKTVGEVLDTVEQDSIFYSRSGGGITLSGGEPLMQAEFATALLRESHRRHIGAAIETCGYVNWEALQKTCCYLSELLFDIKHMDPVKHLQGTGRDNGLILDNFRRVKEEFPHLRVKVRTPVIPKFNDSPEEIKAIVNFVRQFPDTHYELLPYHRLGTQKYAFLDREYTMEDTQLDDSLMENLHKYVSDAGF